jgi:hypothetical protein
MLYLEHYNTIDLANHLRALANKYDPDEPNP